MSFVNIHHHTMEDNIFDMFQEIADAPGEIYDIIREEEFNLDEYIKGDTDY